MEILTLLLIGAVALAGDSAADLLLSYTLPPTWQVRSNLGSLAFVHASDPNNYGGGVRLRIMEGGLDGERARSAKQPGVVVTDITVAGRPGLRVDHPHEDPARAWTGYYVLNARRETLEISIRPAVMPRAEVDAFLASLALLEPPPVPAGLTFEVSGTVARVTPGCKPPQCAPEPVAAEVHLRALAGDGTVGDVVATTRSDASGAYTLQVPPGRYSVVPVDGGTERCLTTTGPMGPCGIFVDDGPVVYHPLLPR